MAWSAETNIRGPQGLTGPVGPIGPVGPPGATGPAGPAGGAANIVISDTPPTGLPSGSLWWESDTGILYLYYNDGTSSQYVAISGGGGDPSRVAKSGDTMTGPLVLPADPTTALQAATKQYVDNNSMTQAASDARYVNVAGDTMTGVLNIQPATGGAAFVLNPTAAASQAVINFYQSGVSKWLFGKQTDDSLILFDAVAGNMALNCPSNGATLTTAKGFLANGNIFAGAGGTTGTYYFGNVGTKYLQYDGSNFNLAGGSLIVSGNIQSSSSSTGAAYYFGPGGTKYLNYDGTQFNFVGGPLNVGGQIYATGSSGIIAGGPVTAGYAGATGGYYFGSTGTKYLIYDGSNFSLAGGTLFCSPINAAGSITNTGGHNLSDTAGTVNVNGACALGVNYLGGATVTGINMLPRTAGTCFPISFYNNAGTFVGGISTTASATAYNTSSDERLKEDLKSFDAGNIIDSTNVYDFAWKATRERSYGVIAQQANEIYPAAVTYKKDEDWWGVDYSKYVPVLLQELKALRVQVKDFKARIEVLEAK